MARGRRPRRVRLRYGDWDPYTALPRAPPRRDRAAHRPRRAGERARGVGRDAGRRGRALLPALRSGRRPSRRRGAHRELRRRAVATLDVPPARREPDRARAPGRARTGGDGPLLAAPRGTGRDARRAAARLGARLPRPPPRESGLPLRRRGGGRARGLAAVPRTAGHRRARERHVRAPAGLVPEFPLHRRARPRPRPRRGPGLAWHLPLGPRARRGGPGPRRGRARARGGRRRAARRGGAAPAALPLAPASGGGRVPRAAREREDDRRRLPVVHRLGPRHVHRHARPLPRHRRPRRCAGDPPRVGRCRLRGHAPEPLSLPRREARVQRSRRGALVRGGRARAPGGRAALGGGLSDEARGHLADVADVDHRPGTVDWTFRPNQIFAVGGLPFAVIEGEQARRVVDAVEAWLVTPLGLRSLAPGESGYTPRYQGGPRERDAAYHQGTVWPWLMGGFVEAWVRVRGGTPAARAEARGRFLEPLLAHLDDAGLAHLPEIADGDPPHAPRGCPFQAWSVGEALRLTRLLA